MLQEADLPRSSRARAYPEALRWPQGVVCMHCGAYGDAISVVQKTTKRRQPPDQSRKADEPSLVAKQAWPGASLPTCTSPLGVRGNLSCSVGLGDDMKAGQLIAGATFDPAQLKAIKTAFDDAWEQIAPHVSDYPRAPDDVRAKLADVILVLAHKGVRNSRTLTREAVNIMLADPNGL